MNIFWAVVTTGIPGFISYWYLDKLRVIYHDEKSKEEKVLVLTSLSLINMGISLFTYGKLNGLSVENILKFSLYSWDELARLFGLTLLISLALTFLVYPKGIEVLEKLAEKGQKEKGAPVTVNTPIMSKLFKHSDFDIAYVYIFNHDKEFIASGYWTEEDIRSPHLIGLSRPSIDNVTYKDIVALYNEQSENSARMLVDFEKDKQIFIFYTDE